MRHLFDQYSQPENRLTHALVSCLSHDRVLLQQFVQWITGIRFPRKQRIYITEQSLPGQEGAEATEEDAEKKGLPDAWIHTEQSWALLIESKISASQSRDQLERHLRMALRRGFTDARLLLVTVNTPVGSPLNSVTTKSWRDIYVWMLSHTNNSEWAREFATYLEIAEVKMARDGYLREGTLTKFAGIRFDEDYPYSYLEAKRILGLLMDELRQRKNLVRDLGILNFPGLHAVKGSMEAGVWDFLRLRESKSARPFTAYPHLTVWVGEDSMRIMTTLPNGVQSKIRKRVLGIGPDTFKKLICEVAYNMERVIAMEPRTQPIAEILQRRYPSRSQPPIHDAQLRFDLRTAAKQDQRNQVKSQPQWLDVTYTVLTQKNANIQFGLGVEISYRGAKLIRSAKAIQVVEVTFYALKPFVDTVLGRR